MPGNRERNKVWWAVIASVVVHLVFAFSLAAFNQVFAPLPKVDESPLELTMMDLSATVPAAPSAPANPAYIETDPSKESPDEPEEKTFESNANSRAASNLPASGDAPLPSQEGKDRPFIQMETQRSSIATQGSVAQPALPTPPPATPPPATPTPAVAVATPRPTAPPSTPLPEPVATPAVDQLAMLTSTPPPPLRDPEDADSTPAPEVAPTAPPVMPRPRPDNPATAYQPEKQETKISGSITDRGRPSVNAVGTPLGRYQKAVTDAIGSRWYYYMNQKIDLVNIGTARIEAEVDRNGKVQKLRVASNNANEAFANICLQSFQEAQIPPIPPDLAATLPEGRLPVEISFTTYANR